MDAMSPLLMAPTCAWRGRSHERGEGAAAPAPHDSALALEPRRPRRGGRGKRGEGAAVPAKRQFATWFAFAGLLLTGFGLSGCNRSDGASGFAIARPEVLRLAFTTSSEEEIERRARAYNDLGDYLAQRLGVKVEVVKGASQSAAIEAMRAGKLDIVNGSPLPYMVAHAKFGAEPLVTPTRENGEATSYHAIFITRPESGLRSLQDVKSRSRELVLAFADPVSTSGHLIPRAHLEDLGLVPEKDFKQVIFSGNHIASVMSAKSGKVDVATVTKTFFERMVSDGRVKPGELTVLWTSPPMQQTIVFTRPGLAPDFRRELEAAYCALHRERPDIWAGLRVLSPTDATHYSPIGDAAFDEYRRIARRIEHLKLLD